MYFQTWIECNFAGKWIPVSTNLKWFSVQSLERKSKDSDWVTSPGTRIDHGAGSDQVLRRPGDIQL